MLNFEFIWLQMTNQNFLTPHKAITSEFPSIALQAKALF